MVEVHCDKCGKNVKIPDTLAGKLSTGTLAGKIFNCPICGKSLTVPSEKVAAVGATQIISFKCCECGEPINVPAEYAGKKGQCATCGAENTVPLPGQELAKKIAAEFGEKPAAPAGKDQEEIPDVVGAKKKTLLSHLTFKAWIALGAILIALVIIAFFVSHDNWEADNKDKLIDSYRQAISYRDNKWYDQACTHYQAILDQIGQRRLNDPDLVDMVNSIKRDLPSLRIKQENIAQQRTAKLKSMEALREAQSQAQRLAAEGNYAAADDKYQEILSMIPQVDGHVPDLPDFTLQIATAKRKVQEELSRRQVQNRKADERLLLTGEAMVGIANPEGLTERQKIVYQVVSFIEFGQFIDSVIAAGSSRPSPTSEKISPSPVGADSHPAPSSEKSIDVTPASAVADRTPSPRMVIISRETAAPMKRRAIPAAQRPAPSGGAIVDTRPAPVDMPASREVIRQAAPVVPTPPQATPDVVIVPPSSPQVGTKTPAATPTAAPAGNGTLDDFVRSAGEFALVCKNAATMAKENLDALPAMAKSLNELCAKLASPAADKNLSQQQADAAAKLSAAIIADAAAIDRSVQLVSKLAQDIRAGAIDKPTGLAMIQKSIETTEKFRKSLDQRIAELEKLAGGK